MGTQITLKEKLPEGNVFSTWQTPGYTSDTKDAVKDNGDGTAIVTVQAGTGAKATLVKVTNTTNIPWYWLLVPLIPLAGAAIPGAPVPQGSSNPQGNTPQVRLLRAHRSLVPTRPRTCSPSSPMAKSSRSKARRPRIRVSLTPVLRYCGLSRARLFAQ